MIIHFLNFVRNKNLNTFIIDKETTIEYARYLNDIHTHYTLIIHL